MKLSSEQLLSLNEVEATVVKASVAAGLDAGCAAPVGRACRWLCAHGFDGLGAVVAALGDDPDECVRDQSAVDLALATGNAHIETQTVLLLLGLAGCAAGDRALELSAEGEGWRCSVHVEGVDFIRGNPPETGAVELSLSAQDSDRRATTSLDHASGVVATEAWSVIVEMAARTYVPSSEQSRSSGAGAGLTDND